MVERPRFAYEFAYVGTLVFALIFWLVGQGAMGGVLTDFSSSVPVVSDDLVKSTAGETKKLTFAIKSKVSNGVRTSVTSGQELVGENAQALVEHTADVSEWTRDKLGIFAERLNKGGHND